MKKRFRLIPAVLLYLFVFQIATFYIPVYAEEITALPSTPELKAASVVLMDADTGIVLYGKDANTQHFPASITKIMTALITLEQCPDLNERISFSRNAVFSLPRNASHIAMDEGETLTVYDALHGLLLSSANEVANALAEHIAGTTEDFALLMNKRAATLGANHTHFENPTGLHGANHTTTAYDMALIMKEAVKHPVFNEIIAKRRHDISPTERQPLKRELLNTNRSIHPGDNFNELIVGGKTGFTDEAQHTLVTFAREGERSLIVSVMNGARPGTYEDTNALLAYGFALPYEEQLIFDSNAYERMVPVYHDAERVGEITLRGADDLYFMLPAGFNRADIRYEAEWPEKVSTPVLIGDVLGKVTCFIQDKKIGEVVLSAVDPMFAPIKTAADASEAETESETELVMAMGTPPMNLPIESELSIDESALSESKLSTLEATEEKEPDTSAGALTGKIPPVWEKDYWLTFALPLTISALALLFTIILFFTKRKRRQAQILQFDRYSKYSNVYKIK